MLLYGVNTDAKHDRLQFFEFWKMITERASLDSTAWSIVLGIKVQQNPRAGVVFKRVCFSFLVGQDERGGAATDFRR